MITLTARLPGLIATTTAALPPAILATIALWGRTSLSGLALHWLVTAIVLTSTTIVWVWFVEIWVYRTPRTGDQHLAIISQAWRGLLPSTGVALLAVIAIYRNDDLFHALAHEPRFAGTLLPTTLILTGAAPWVTHRRTIFPAEVANRWRHLITVTSLLAIGVTTSGAWHVVTLDDLIRYWAVTDAWRTGMGYAVTGGIPGSGAYYLVELPIYPLLTTVAFSAMGHTYAALRTPAIVVGAMLPLATWASARKIGASPLWAFVVAVALPTIPHYRTYVVGAAQPDGTFATVVMVVIALVAHATPDLRGDRPFRVSLAIAIAVTATVALLTRPEGLILVGAIALGAIGAARPLRWPTASWQAVGIGLLVAAVPLVSFVAVMYQSFGIIWPAGWGNVASGTHIWPNLDTINRNNLTSYAATIGLPPELGPPIAIVTLVTIIVGMIALVRRQPVLVGVPLASLLSISVILTTPTMLALDNFSPITFYRHAAVAFPCVAVAIAALGPRDGYPTTRSGLAVITVAIAIIGANLWVLGDATARDHDQQLTIYAPEPVVTTIGLWRIAPPLPILPMVAGPGNGSSVAETFDFRGVRQNLWQLVRSIDQHVEDDGRAWAIATALLTVTGITGIIRTSHTQRP